MCLGPSSQVELAVKMTDMLSIVPFSRCKPRVFVLAILAAFTCTVLFQLLKYALEFLRVTVWIPWTVTRYMRKQGYSGPPFNCWKSNRKEMQELTKKAVSEPLHTVSHDIEPRLFASAVTWKKLYGKKFIYYPQAGGRVFISTTDPEAVKEMWTTKFNEYERSHATALAMEIVGKGGLFFAEREEWSRQRRLVRPVYYGRRSKDMVGQMATWIEPWLQNLEKLVVENGGPVDTDMVPAVKELTDDILARSSFGSNFKKGREAFEHQDKLRYLVLRREMTANPLLRWFLMSTPLQKEIRQVKSQLTKCLRKMIEDRRQSTTHAQLESSESYGEDLLGILLGNSDKGSKRTDDHIVDQCRSFFFAGSETVRSAILWAIVLLAHHIDWQERIRAEGKEAFQDTSPNGDTLMKLKQLEVFVEETLRLYPPAPYVVREVAKANTTLVGESVPKCLCIQLNIVGLHRQKEYWGDDALEFNPDRFTDGAANASRKLAHAFAPFGGGPRTCIAEAFALTEVKLVTTMLLQRFSFRLSPSYRHEPTFNMTLQPKFGVQIILDRL